MKSKLILLFLCVVLLVASCSTQDDESVLHSTESMLTNKKWYRIGSNGQNWVLYKPGGNWESQSGDYGSWRLSNGKVLQINATYDLLGSWEEDILEISDSYLRTRVKGTTMPKEYSTAL